MQIDNGGARFLSAFACFPGMPDARDSVRPMRFINGLQAEPGMRPVAVTDLLNEFGSHPR